MNENQIAALTAERDALRAQVSSLTAECDRLRESLTQASHRIAGLMAENKNIEVRVADQVVKFGINPTAVKHLSNPRFDQQGRPLNPDGSVNWTETARMAKQ